VVLAMPRDGEHTGVELGFLKVGSLSFLR
jgi:hypothetical protein